MRKSISPSGRYGNSSHVAVCVSVFRKHMAPCFPGSMPMIFTDFPLKFYNASNVRYKNDFCKWKNKRPLEAVDHLFRACNPKKLLSDKILLIFFDRVKNCFSRVSGIVPKIKFIIRI